VQPSRHGGTETAGGAGDENDFSRERQRRRFGHDG
jgi:hypothetical protein